MTEVQFDEPQKRGPGRPRKFDPARDIAREPTREGTRDRVIRGRDGEVLSRKQTSVSDPYFVPLELKEPGWDYQWNAVSVVNNTEVVVHQDSMMQANGWRPVPANRAGFKERFGMADDKRNPGNVIVLGGLRLDERPMELSEEAKHGEYNAAIGQIKDRDNALTGGKANLRGQLNSQQMPMTHGYKGRNTQVKLDIETEAPRPTYQYGTDE